MCDGVDLKMQKYHKYNILYLMALMACVNIITTQTIFAELTEEQFAEKIKTMISEVDPYKREKLLNNIIEVSNDYQRYVILPKAAKTSIETGHYMKAENYANELLHLASSYKDDWNLGNAIHDANMILGMVALKKNLIETAKTYLLKAGGAPISPQLKTFGPNMMLAKALLERGEKETVIEYMTLMKAVWKYDDGRLESWISAIKGGGKPYFGDNLMY